MFLYFTLYSAPEKKIKKVVVYVSYFVRRNPRPPRYIHTEKSISQTKKKLFIPG